MWKAIYNDVTLLSQFDENIEHLFSEIDHQKIVTFRVELTDAYAVNLEDGSFSIGGARFKFDGYEGEKFNLIYFRRVRQTLGADSKTSHHIGWQIKGSDKGKSNHQRIMVIDEETESIIFQVK
jgi:hypothetical protein